MGMIIVLALGVYVVIATIIILVISRFITKNRWVIGILTTIAILIPTYDIIITNILGAYYCLAGPNPKTLIKKKVEYPLSIYWEDNIYPGFNAEDRKLMITNYLDGVHLKTMALNGDDGKVYVYRLDKPMWEEVKKEFDASKYKNIYEQYAQSIIEASEQIYAKETMPKMNYTVTFNEIKLDSLSQKFLYSDETKVIDNNTNEVMAYNRRYMRFFYILAPDFAGGRYYAQGSVCGERVAHLEYKVFDAYQWSKFHLGDHQRNLHTILIDRNKQKGE